MHIYIRQPWLQFHGGKSTHRKDFERGAIDSTRLSKDKRYTTAVRALLIPRREGEVVCNVKRARAQVVTGSDVRLARIERRGSRYANGSSRDEGEGGEHRERKVEVRKRKVG